MKIIINAHSVLVTGLHIKKAVNSFLFQKWLRTIDSSFIVKRVEIQSLDFVTRGGEEKILFLKLKADIVDDLGRFVPGIMFLRGDSVAILPILQTEKREYAVLVDGALPSIGKISYPRLPAGMMDTSYDVLAVAGRELKEETNLDPQNGELINITEVFFGNNFLGIYPSPGACDEQIHFVLYRQKITEEELQYESISTGVMEENEYLSRIIIPLEKLCRYTADTRAHSMYMMYTQLKKTGELS